MHSITKRKFLKPDEPRHPVLLYFKARSHLVEQGRLDVAAVRLRLAARRLFLPLAQPPLALAAVTVSAVPVSAIPVTAIPVSLAALAATAAAAAAPFVVFVLFPTFLLFSSSL